MRNVYNLNDEILTDEYVLGTSAHHTSVDIFGALSLAESIEGHIIDERDWSYVNTPAEQSYEYTPIAQAADIMML